MRVGIHRHAVGQGAGLAALARLALAAARRRAREAAAAPGPWLAATVPPRSRAFVRDYLLENGGDPGAWEDELPPHLLAWFGMPLALRVIAGLPLPVQRTLAMHARAVEALGASLPGGARSLRAADVRFARPLVLPAAVGVYARAGALWLGTGPGEPAHLVGTFG